jgi:glutamate racemase
MRAQRSAPIGVFDSGVGGLTVLRALQAELAQEHFVYLGDTARLPYGTKSPETVVRYGLQAAHALLERGVKALIIACNTASAVALPAMAQRYRDVPLIGVVHPGADAAVAATRSGHIAVIATEATVRGGAYQRAILARRPDARITAVPCQLFVALAEEGWTEGSIARAVAERYLAELFGEEARAQAHHADTLVLGCTHFPMLRSTIRAVVGEQVAIVDSAATTAASAHALLRQRGLVDGEAPDASTPALRLLATDGAERFAAVGSRFLGRSIGAGEVELIDL